MTSNSLELRVICPDENNFFVSDSIIIEYNSTLFNKSGTLNETVTNSSQVCGRIVMLGNLISGLKYQVGIRLTIDDLEGERSEVADFTTS